MRPVSPGCHRRVAFLVKSENLSFIIFNFFNFLIFGKGQKNPRVGGKNRVSRGARNTEFDC